MESALVPVDARVQRKRRIVPAGNGEWQDECAVPFLSSSHRRRRRRRCRQR